MTNSVVVTGAGGGIGFAACLRLADAGWWVVGVDSDAGKVAAVARMLETRGNVVLGDVRDRAVLDEAAALGMRGDRQLTGWVNNAAIARLSALHETVPEEFEAVLDVNLKSYFWGCQAAVRAFLEQRTGGAIVNVSSVHGRVAYSDYAAYDVAKGGVDALTRYVAVEYGPVGIRANGIAPGAVLTPMSRTLIERADDPAEFKREIEDQSPLRRFADPEEIARAIEFLLGPHAGFITGQTLAVDGGLTAAAMPFPLHHTLRDRLPTS